MRGVHEREVRRARGRLRPGTAQRLQPCLGVGAECVQGCHAGTLAPLPGLGEAGRGRLLDDGVDVIGVAPLVHPAPCSPLASVVMAGDAARR